MGSQAVQEQASREKTKTFGSAAIQGPTVPGAAGEIIRSNVFIRFATIKGNNNWLLKRTDRTKEADKCPT